MEYDYLMFFYSANRHPILCRIGCGEPPSLIVWRNRAFLRKLFSRGRPIYQEIEVAFWSEPSEEAVADDLVDKHRLGTRITPVIFESEGESSELFSIALELIQDIVLD